MLETTVWELPAENLASVKLRQSSDLIVRLEGGVVIGVRQREAPSPKLSC